MGVCTHTHRAMHIKEISSETTCNFRKVTSLDFPNSLFVNFCMNMMILMHSKQTTHVVGDHKTLDSST